MFFDDVLDVVIERFGPRDLVTTTAEQFDMIELGQKFFVGNVLDVWVEDTYSKTDVLFRNTNVSIFGGICTSVEKDLRSPLVGAHFDGMHDARSDVVQS